MTEPVPMPQPPRLPLSEVELTGGKRSVRQGILYILIGLAAVVAALHWVDSHRYDPSWSDSGPDWSRWHSYGADLGVLPVFGMLLVAAAAYGASRARFGWGLLAALVTSGVGFFAFFAAVLTHLLSSTQNNEAGTLYLLALFLLLLLGIAMIVVEPWTHMSTRSAMERAHQQQIPGARVVSRKR